MALTTAKKKEAKKKARINCYAEPAAKKKLGDMCTWLDRSENYLLNKALEEYIANHYEEFKANFK